MTAALDPAAMARMAALRVQLRQRVLKKARVVPSALEWARDRATIIHPIRGRIPFEPYPFQEEFLEDDAPRRLIVKARQIGFSQVVGIEAAHKATNYLDRTILLVSRNQRLAGELLDYCYNAISGLRGEVPALVKHNTQELEFANGSRVISLPSNRSTGRGFAASDVYLDEYAFQAYATDVYRSVSPTVGHGGTLTVFSSPDGRGNHFFQLWSGIEGGEWSRMRVPWRDCPVYDEAWYERERPNYTAADWAQEFECDFVVSGEAVFNPDDIAAAADGWRGLQPPLPGRDYVHAWDIGRRKDATVGVTLDISDPDDWQVVAFERELGLPYPVIQQRIERRQLAYGGVTVIESNGVGDPVIENLRVEVFPFTTTRKTKTDAITAMALAYERRRLKHDIERLRIESELYQWQDANIVQDTVMATAIACAVADVPMPLDQLLVQDEGLVTIGPRF